jgi:hypothetical protein
MLYRSNRDPLWAWIECLDFAKGEDGVSGGYPKARGGSDRNFVIGVSIGQINVQSRSFD